MARKLTEKPAKPIVAPDKITPDMVRETVDEIRDKRAVLSTAQTAHAGAYKEAEGKGLHRKALKLTIDLAKMEPRIRLAYIRHFQHYVGILDLDKDPQRELFGETDGMPSRADVADAVGDINMVNTAPDPAHPAEYEGQKRKINAWNKGVQFRRENIAREKAGREFTSDESNQICLAGWDAMDTAIMAVMNGGSAPVADASAAVAGLDIPDGMSKQEFDALLQDGMALFRADKSPGDHADAEDPVKARILQLGWAQEQDAQAAAQAAETTAEELAAAKAEGAKACAEGLPQSQCPYEPGSAKADAWLEGWEEQDGALFAAAAPGSEPAADSDGADGAAAAEDAGAATIGEHQEDGGDGEDGDDDEPIPEMPDEEADADVPVAAMAAAAAVPAGEAVFGA